MATPSQILNARYINEEYVPKRVSDVFDTTKSLTGELYGGDVLRNLERTGGVPVFLQDADVEPEPNVPTLDVILTRLGVKEDNDPTGEKAARKFVEQFTDPKKHSVWKDKVMKDPAWGKRGWDTIVEAFKRTSKDLMNADIQKARYDAVHDGTVASAIAEFMFPRVVKAAEEGRDPGASEWGRDIAANALYAVPFGGIARTVAPASRVLQFGSQATAPVIVAGMDKVADPDYTWSDAALDATIGTAANLGVNKWLAPRIGQLIGTAKGGIARKIPRVVKAALEDNPTSRDAAQATVEKATQVLKAPTKSAGEMALDIASGATKGVSAEEKATSQAIKDIYDASREKVYGQKPSDVLKALAETKNITDMTNKDVAGMVGDIVAGSRKPFAGVDLNDDEAVMAAIAQLTKDRQMYSKVLEANPELMSLFHSQSLKAPFTPTNMAKTYVVNQIGSSDPDIAKGAISSLTTGKVDADKVRKSAADSKAKARSQAAVDKILASGGLTDEDREYLGRVRENPDVLKFSQDQGFKTWLLTRGNDLLQGTPAYRPTWDVR